MNPEKDNGISTLNGSSPEVLTNSWLSVPLDIPNKRETIVNIRLMKDWRFLPTTKL